MILPALLLAACFPLANEVEQITAGDLAAAETVFAAIPAATPICLAPAAGVPRTFGAGELVRVARSFGLDMKSAGQACFERPTAVLDPKRLAEAMRNAIGDTETQVEIVDYSRYPAPLGPIEFLRTAFPAVAPAQPATAVLWRGVVRYGGNRRFAIWARVRILVRTVRVIAAQPLPAGRIIQAEQLRLETGAMFPARESPIGALEQAIGRVPSRSIRAGATLLAAQLDMPYDVARGDRVRVEVVSGEARLELDGRAEAAGRMGEVIPVRNPANGKRFRARVVGAGKVEAGGQL